MLEYRGQGQEKHSDSLGLCAQPVPWGEDASAQHMQLNSLVSHTLTKSYLTMELGNLEPGLLQNFLQRLMI